jgi:DNA-binding CsgD family transcriptional regulator
LITLGKPTPNVDLLQLTGVQLTNGTIDQSCSLKSRVVDNHGHMVTRKPDVKLDPVRAIADCA